MLLIFTYKKNHQAQLLMRTFLMQANVIFLAIKRISANQTKYFISYLGELKYNIRLSNLNLDII